MAVQPVDITGGESVYCINQAQLTAAFQLVKENPTSGPKIQLMKKSITDSLNRNERAALAFVLIDELLKTPS